MTQVVSKKQCIWNFFPTLNQYAFETAVPHWIIDKEAARAAYLPGVLDGSDSWLIMQSWHRLETSTALGKGAQLRSAQVADSTSELVLDGACVYASPTLHSSMCFHCVLASPIYFMLIVHIGSFRVWTIFGNMKGSFVTWAELFASVFSISSRSTWTLIWIWNR